MRIAALYDIHGNAPALEAVLAEISNEGVDAIVVGGDILAGPLPSTCLSLLRQLSVPTYWLLGNAESDVLAHLAGEEIQGLGPKSADVAVWVAEQLSDDEKQFLTTWTMMQPFEFDVLGTVLFCHATLQNNVDVFTIATSDEEARKILGETSVSTVICGHTHMQFDRQLGEVRVVNAGSVGMPFGGQGAFWLLVDETVELRRTVYDYEGAAARIRQSNDPDAADFAANNVLQSPSREAALGFMAQIAARQAVARGMG
ncbi:MAG: metallophosphoesterase family protein [Candidatus Promineifilaceae bacterium]